MLVDEAFKAIILTNSGIYQKNIWQFSVLNIWDFDFCIRGIPQQGSVDVTDCLVNLRFRIKKQATWLNLVPFASQKYTYCHI